MSKLAIGLLETRNQQTNDEKDTKHLLGDVNLSVNMTKQRCFMEIVCIMFLVTHNLMLERFL